MNKLIESIAAMPVPSVASTEPAAEDVQLVAMRRLHDELAEAVGAVAGGVLRELAKYSEFCADAGTADEDEASLLVAFRAAMLASLKVPEPRKFPSRKHAIAHFMRVQNTLKNVLEGLKNVPMLS